MQKHDLYVKRDDELSFSLSGSKLRKYASLLPFLEQKKQEVAVVGSPYSNHVLSLVQLLKQRNIPHHIFVEKPPQNICRGNFFFLSLLLQKKEMTFCSAIPNDLTRTWCTEQERMLGRSFFWIPLGACMPEALIGALTLALDILENEKVLQEPFAEIFVDAGTGLTAIALILGFAYVRKQTLIHVVLVAGKEKEFEEKLIFFHKHLESLLQESIPFPRHYHLIFPITGKSFGSCNQKIFQTIKQVAEDEGFFLDPIYTAKLFLTAKEKAPHKRTLWVHSGGALSLSGFQDSFTQKLFD